MRIQIENKVSLILILMAVASLVSMVATLNIDHIINSDLYKYGLQFSTKWADPYWTMAAIVISMGWTIIATSIVFELYLVTHRMHRLPESQPETHTVQDEPVQNKTPPIETKPSNAPADEQPKISAEEEPKTTALAMTTINEMSEFRALLEKTTKLINAPLNTDQKAEDNRTNEKQ